MKKAATTAARAAVYALPNENLKNAKNETKNDAKFIRKNIEALS